MPTITIRLSPSEKAAVESAARVQGQSLSDYVRETLRVRDNDDVIAGLNARVEALWTKVARLEAIAHID